MAMALALCLLLNAFLTLIAEGRLWLLTCWRERPAADVAATSAGEAARTGPATAGIAATALLTLLVVVAGLWPSPVLQLGSAAAAGLLDPAGYVAAVGLAGDR